MQRCLRLTEDVHDDVERHELHARLPVLAVVHQVVKPQRIGIHGEHGQVQDLELVVDLVRGQHLRPGGQVQTGCGILG